jgi:hypothetical protein
MEETHDSVPEVISPDTFDRETGERIPVEKERAAAALTPGEDRGADHINAPGPR